MKSLDERFEEVEALAARMGLDPFPVIYEVVPREIIWEVSSYGLPTRMSHWSFGKSFVHQKTYGEMGYSKTYELILNNNPSFAFLDETNPDVTNLLICAHCYVPGTMVQTQKGIKAIESIVPGDVVFNAKGNKTTVVRPTSRNYKGEIVSLLAGSYNFSQTPEHRLLTVKTRASDRISSRSWANFFCSSTFKKEWVRADELKAGDFLVVNKPRNIGLGTMNSISFHIDKVLHRQHIKKTMKIKMDEGFGKLVGLFLAEGYSRPKGQMGLCFDSREIDLIEEAEGLVKEYLGLECYRYESPETHSLQVGFNEIGTAYFVKKSFGDRHDRKALPEAWIRNSPPEFLRGVLYGFLMGDGDKRSPRSMGFSTTSPLLAMQIQAIAMKNGIYFGIDTVNKSTPNQARKDAYVGRGSGTHDAAVRSLLGMKPRELSRTWSGIIEQDDCFLVKISKVCRSNYEGMVHCMEVREGESFSLANGIITHNCLGHSDFFKNNACFAKTNRSMVNQSEQFAHVIEDLKEKHGIEAVEDWMDIAFSIDRHIDWAMGENRPRYPQQEHVFKKVDPLPYADLFGEDLKPSIKHEIRNKDFPPHRERDLIWFLGTYAQMLPWQREVFSMIRAESFYFYPQFLTKIMNEGWASYWHAELMLNYEDLTAAEHMDFSKVHSGVVSAGQGGSMNPYYVGFRIFGDIKKRWDEYYEAGQKDAAFLKSGLVDHYDEDGNVVMSRMNGAQKILQVRADDDDVSFVRNYLTKDLAQDMKLFRYGMRGASSDPEEDDIILKSRDLEKIIEAMTSRLHNYGAPPIFIEEVRDADRSLILVHDESDKTPLDELYARETLKYVAKTWGHKVSLRTRDRFGKVITYVVDEKSEVKSGKDEEDQTIVEVNI